MRKLLSTCLILALLLVLFVPAHASEDKYAPYTIHSHYWKAFYTGYTGIYTFSATRVNSTLVDSESYSYLERNTVLLQPGSTVTVETAGYSGPEWDAIITGYTETGTEYWFPLKAGTYTVEEVFGLRDVPFYTNVTDNYSSGTGLIGPFACLYLAAMTPVADGMEMYEYYITIDKNDLSETKTEADFIVFADVPEDVYYAPAVQWARSLGVTNGTGSDANGNALFSPEDTVTRGQAVTFLWRAIGKPEPATHENPFTDVMENDYYFHAVLWAVENGITNGRSADAFAPGEPVKRSEMLTFLWRTLGKPGETGESPWYADAERWGSETGCISGTASAYSTNAACPRSDVVYYLWQSFLLA